MLRLMNDKSSGDADHALVAFDSGLDDSEKARRGGGPVEGDRESESTQIGDGFLVDRVGRV